MRAGLLFVSAAAVFLSAGSGSGETVESEFGGDVYAAGDTVVMNLDAGRDAFVFGQSANVGGAVVGDMHAAGFDVIVQADVAGDLYAAGGTVGIRAPVSGDVSAFGFTVRTEPGVSVEGNSRLAGNTVTAEGSVGGALSVMARSAIMNAEVSGDVSIVAKSVVFGPDARVDGILSYRAEEPINVPESVAPAERVRYAQLDMPRDWDVFGEDWPMPMRPSFPTAGALFGGFIISLLFFVILGAIALGFMPERLEEMRRGISAAPGRSILLGVLGLSLLFGLVPIVAMTIVGIPLIPVVVLCIVAVWMFGYALGGYALALHVWAAFGGSDSPTQLVRLSILAAAITIVAILNFIPFVGWVANYTLTLLGVGAITKALFGRLIVDSSAQLGSDLQGTPE